MLVKEFTQVSGGFLDHVFIHKDITVDIDLQSIVITTHFSDHDVVFLILHIKTMNDILSIYTYMHILSLLENNIRHFY